MVESRRMEASPLTQGPDQGAKPSLFFSYSMAEQTSVLLSTIVWLVFHSGFKVCFTPSALTSGQSQLIEIEKQIAESALGVVCLDGLRPNVVHEWGYMRGAKKPVILLKKEDATVDVRHFVGGSVPALQNPPLDMNVHLSNLKDINYARWYPGEVPRSAKAVWEEFNKIKNADLPDIKEPHLW
jgi:hypothetical protein